MSEPIYCEVRGHWCRCHDYGKRCDDFDEDELRMRDWPRLVADRVMERLELSQSASTAPTTGRMTELENPLGVSRGRSVETSPEDRGMSRAAGHRLLPHEYLQLAKGAQENAPQRSDASPSPYGDESHD